MKNGKDLCSMIYERCGGESIKADGPEFIFLFIFVFIFMFIFILILIVKFIFIFTFMYIYIFQFRFLFLFIFIFIFLFLFIFLFIPVDRRVQMAGLRQKQGFLSTYSSDLKGRLPPK